MITSHQAREVVAARRPQYRALRPVVGAYLIHGSRGLLLQREPLRWEPK